MTLRRIDVHQHIVPPAYLDWLKASGIADAGGTHFPTWSAAETVELMDRHGIATGIVSVSTPGVHLRPDLGKNPEAREWARRVNEFSAQVAADHPGRFGFFATLPLPDVEGALEEVRYAFDGLGASGVVLLANTHGIYLGDPSHEPLLEELNRRNAVVFVHPSELPCAAVAGIPTFAADFLLDTTRAAYQLVANGCVKRHSNLRIILSHAGGFVPYSSHRMAMAIAGELGPKFDGAIDGFRSFYFDTALSGSPAALPSLLAFAKPGHVLFGSDWPFAPEAAVGYFTGQLDAYAGIDDQARHALERGSASQLFPPFA
jgi:predicted TIM-barrel fold metal-dependent hydrolase